MMDEFARVLREQIRKDMNNYADDLANGQCSDYAQYQKLCGVIRGLAIAEEYIQTLLTKVKQQDD